MTTARTLSLALCLAACSEQATTAPGDAAVDAPSVDAPSIDAAVDAAPAVDATPAVDAPPPAPVRATAPYVRYVDPRIGTGGLGFGTGSAFPGPQRAFGLARPGPDTSNDRGDAPGFSHCAGYAYADTHIGSFSQLHMHGTGIVDYGALGFMPTVGMTAAKTRAEGRLEPFRHERETVEAGYYRVAFDGSETVTEVTATEHVALYRVTFARGAQGNLLFDVGHTLSDVRVTQGEVEVDAAAGELRGRVRFEGGYSNRVGGVDAYWVARTSRPLAGAGTWSDGALAPAALTQTGIAVGAYVPVDTSADATVTVAIGLSFTDVAHARANLAAEAADLDFDRARRESVASWESLLSRVRVEARGEAALTTLYSAVYRTLLMPTLASDVDGTYRGVDKMVRRAEGFRYYTDLSLWDTYRTEHPWLTMVYPEYQRDFVRSIMAMADVLGFYPRWPLGTGETGGMLGDCGALMVADTWLRGLRDYDAPHAWDIARAGAFATPSRREALDDYMTLRYVPVEGSGSSASKTMEYAYADGALSRMARGLGHDADADALAQRATSYRNLYDPAQRWMVGRHRDGSFAPMPRAESWQDYYAEGNAWQYLWFAPHDLDGLATVLGGRDAMLSRLDEMFTLTMNARRTPLPDNYYWHGNEPDIHAPWIPSAFDDFAAASRYVDWVRNNRYGAGPDGIPGNDDAGTMSAWYVFAALGVFPIAGTDDWLLAAPSVTDAEVSLAGGATLHVSAPSGGAGLAAARSIRWGAEALAHPRMTQAQVAAGGTLAFDLGQ
jgi:predicted alpha-1,2-mannosidase